MLRRSFSFLTLSISDTAASSGIVTSVTKDRVAYITLNRPKQLNALIDETGPLLRSAVESATDDDSVGCIVISGAGGNFSSGYDLAKYLEKPNERAQQRDPNWCLIKDYKSMKKNTDDWMSLFRSTKPTIAAVAGACVGGGSDIALCCDLLVCSDSARLGYPPSTLWGCPTTFWWSERVGPQRAKLLMFTGDTLSGQEAASCGLSLKSVPSVADLETEVVSLAQRIAKQPENQLAMSKLVCNTQIEMRGISTTQTMATLFDGFSRHSPEGKAWKQFGEEHGWKKAVAQREKSKRK